MIKRIKCIFGFHEWTFFETLFGVRWRCKNCGKWRDEW